MELKNLKRTLLINKLIDEFRAGKQYELQTVEIALLQTFAVEMDKRDSDSLGISLKEMGDLINASRPTVLKYINCLVEKDVLIREYRDRGNRKVDLRPNKYTLNLDKIKSYIDSHKEAI